MKTITLFLVFISFSAPVFAAETGITPEAGSPAKAAETSAPAMLAADFKGPEKLLQAAKSGDAAAQLEIAILYEYGFNMPDNEVYALAWYILAADRSTKAATHRDRLVNKLSAAKVAEAKKMSQTLVSAGSQAPMGAPEAAPQTMPVAPDQSPADMPLPPEDLPMPIEEMPEPSPENQ